MSSWLARPQGLVCLMTATVGAAKSQAAPQAASASRMLLKESSLPSSCFAQVMPVFGLGADGQLGVEGRLLVGVLAVAQAVALLHGDGHLLGEAVLALAQVLGDGGVVDGHVLEGLLGQPLALGERQVALLQLLQHDRVVGRVDDHDDAGEVLGRGADHGRPADVDVLQGLFQGDAFFGDRLDEGVEVDGHQVDRSRCCSSASSAMWAGRSRRARMPPWTIGCRVLTRPSRISGKPVMSETLFTGTPASADGLLGAAGAEDLEAELRSGLGRNR